MSLINEALKQTRGAPSQSRPDGPPGIPISHPPSEDKRGLRTDILLVSVVLLLSLLLLGGAALFYLAKQGAQSAAGSSRSPASVTSPSSPLPAHATTPDVVGQAAARIAPLPASPAQPRPAVSPGTAQAKKTASPEVQATRPPARVDTIPEQVPAVSAVPSPGAQLAPAGTEEVTPAVSPAPPANAPGGSSQLPAARETLAKLKASLKLTAIIGSGASARVLVNSRICKIGDTLDGALVVAIGNDAVTLALGGEKTDLTLH